jgi:hypothetical protein
VRPGVELHQNRQRDTCTGRRPRVPAHRESRVGGHAELRPLGQHHQPRQLGLANDVVGQEDLRKPRVCHHLRLAHLLARDTDRSSRHLPVRDLGHLVRLDVRAVSDAVVIQISLKPVDIGLHPIQIDNDGGGLQRVHVHRT